jgi:UDP-N-acetylmuramoylalanine--D-glutamate ligase
MQKKILIIGLGVSGRSCAAFLLQQGFSLVAVDRKIESLKLDPKIKVLIDLGLEVQSDSSPLAWESFSQIIVSPGVDPSHPIVQKGGQLGIEVIGEIELAFRYLKNRCIGITGTNGKTTTTLLTTHVLNQMGIAARPLGNVGSSLSGYLIDANPNEILIIELSSFQLETVQTRALDAALILNITPNHLDRHPSMQAYSSAKLRIQNCLKEPFSRFYISSQVAAEYGADLKKFEIFDASISPIGYTERGVAVEQNIQAACCLCHFFGVSSSDFYEKMKTFQKPPHRMEWVAEIDQVAYYNDSKATNVDAVRHAVAQLPGSIILIAGGVDKGSSYRPWIDSFSGKVKKIVVFGQAAEKIYQELTDFFSIEKVETLEQALKVARNSAIEKDVVLLSPGCSSYDQFLNYEARGEAFKRKVLGI